MKKDFKIIDKGIFGKSLNQPSDQEMLTPMEALQIFGGCAIQACGAKACGCDTCFGNITTSDDF